MGWGIDLPSLPSLSDVRNTVTQTYDSARETVRDLGETAVQRASDLGRAGLDLGRQGVEAVRNFDVREAAAAVRDGIGGVTETARQGISDGVMWAGDRVEQGADFARSQITGDDPFSQAARGLITGGESLTRFQLGVAGGVTREAVGLVGAVGQLGTTAAEMQLSPEARMEYGQQAADFATGAARATGGYLQSVAQDPSRIGGDLQGAWNGASGFVGGQLDRYGQAIANGQGPETIGIDVGTVATYVVPIGGGPARGALTGAVRTGAREGVEAGVRSSADDIAELAASSRRTGGEIAVYRDPVTTQRITAGGAADELQNVGSRSAAQGDDYGVAFFGEGNLKYYTPDNATLGRDGGAFFHMPLADSAAVTDAASAARYTGMSPSTLQAYQSGGDIYGISFPTAGLNQRLPTAADAGGWPHFLEGGHTAVRTGDDPAAGYLVNPTREFVIPGGGAVPEGSVLFRLDGGAWEPMKRF